MTSLSIHNDCLQGNDPSVSWQSLSRCPFSGASASARLKKCAFPEGKQQWKWEMTVALEWSPELRNLPNTKENRRESSAPLIFRLYDEIGTTDKCTPQAKLEHVKIPTKRAICSQKSTTTHNSKWRICLNFNENGAKVRTCAAPDTAH